MFTRPATPHRMFHPPDETTLRALWAQKIERIHLQPKVLGDVAGRQTLGHGEEPTTSWRAHRARKFKLLASPTLTLYKFSQIFKGTAVVPQQLDLHTVLDHDFRRILAGSFQRNITASGEAISDVAGRLGRDSPEPLVAGMLVWNFVLNALQDVAESRPELNLVVPPRGKVRLFHYQGLPFIPYRVHTKATASGLVGITATEKKYVARLLREHQQVQIFADEANTEPLPAILAYDVQAAISDDGTLAMRLEEAYFAYPTAICAQEALSVPFGPNAVKIFPAPLAAVEMEIERRFDPGTIKIRLIKPGDEGSDSDS